MNIGLSVQVLLAKNNMKKKELAQKLGRHPTSITALCRSESCSKETLDKLCEVFGMKASELIALGE